MGIWEGPVGLQLVLRGFQGGRDAGTARRVEGEMG